ncbi:ATP/GTP-binding protein [Frankia sp. R43]|nr:ATP/GTP-binding protein [Frankia sp. R43]
MAGNPFRRRVGGLVLVRIASVLAIVGAVCAGGVGPARAESPPRTGQDDQGFYGSVNCDQNPHPGCELFAGGRSTPAAPAAPQDSAPDTSGGGEGSSAAPGDQNLTPPETAKCAYVRSDYQPPAAGIRTIVYQRPARGGLVVLAARAGSGLSVQTVASQPGQGPGAWYLYQCTTDGVRDALYRPPVWLADPPAPGPAVDPEALAAQARDHLGLAGPAISMSPVRDQLVRLPTWLWLDTAGWNPVAATAAAGGVSVTAVARPVAVDWSMGDGGTVTCLGPGTPFPAGADPKSASPDCGYTYTHRSLDEPGGTFTLTATVRWDVTWAGAGQTGAFPGLTTYSTVQARVIDIPALVTGGR